ncbi:MAG TPA: YcbK family protein [Acidobacteriaceae bacterium]
MKFSQTSANTCQASNTPTPRKRSFWNAAVLTLFTLVLTVVTVPVRASVNLAPGEIGSAVTASALTGQKYHLKLYHLHTGESVDVVYRIGDTYLPAALAKLNYLLRDDRNDDQSHYDPREFDLLHNLLSRLGRPNAVVDIVCGYRTPETNEYLRTRGPNTGVARHSQHTLAKAIDIRIPGVTTRKLRDIALSLGAGGVGYYPISKFVHVDVGPVRKWTFRGNGND